MDWDAPAAPWDSRAVLDIDVELLPDCCVAGAVLLPGMAGNGLPLVTACSGASALTLTLTAFWLPPCWALPMGCKALQAPSAASTAAADGEAVTGLDD